MSLSLVKKEILETLSRCGKPMRATDVAKEAGKQFPPVMMHLLGLVKMGYVTSPEKGLYVINDKGKEAIAQPEMTKEKAEAILAYAPHDRAFHFYTALGEPLPLHAHGLRDFANKVERADLASIQFHMGRGDFEAWFHGLGDDELAKKVDELRKQNPVGETMRTQLREIVEERYIALAKLTGQQISPE